MKKLVLISFIFCSIAAGALAQEPGTKTPEERAQIQNEWMKENLQLSEDQIPRVELLNLEYAQKMEEVKKMSGKLSQLKAARNIGEEKDGKLKEILTKDQFNIYQNKKKELRSTMMEVAKDRKAQ
jgi:hypothetical protein